MEFEKSVFLRQAVRSQSTLQRQIKKGSLLYVFSNSQGKNFINWEENNLYDANLILFQF
jgi:hypothetical protein